MGGPKVREGVLPDLSISSQPVLLDDSCSHRLGGHSQGVREWRHRHAGRTGTSEADFSVSKTSKLRLASTVGSSFPVEFCNVLGHPQFANSQLQFHAPTFGISSSTAVNPRVVRLALRFAVLVQRASKCFPSRFSRIIRSKNAAVMLAVLPALVCRA